MARRTHPIAQVVFAVIESHDDRYSIPAPGEERLRVAFLRSLDAADWFAAVVELDKIVGFLRTKPGAEDAIEPIIEILRLAEPKLEEWAALRQESLEGQLWRQAERLQRGTRITEPLAKGLAPRPNAGVALRPSPPCGAPVNRAVRLPAGVHATGPKPLGTRR